MADPRIENLAKILVEHSVKVKPGDWVAVTANTLALPLVNEVVRHVIRAGGRPNVLLDSDEITETTLCEMNFEQLEWVSPIEKMVYDQVDILISLRASANTRSLSGIDPQKARARQTARRGLMETYMKRSADNSLRWVVSQFPTTGYAQDADMSLREYENFVYAATFADQPDPVQKWRDIYTRQQRLVEWLDGKKEIVVRGPSCELKLSVAGRKFINCYGDKNMPDGEIFTGPVEDSMNGWIHFTYPAIKDGREVEGVELEFKDGKVVNARAQKNEEFLVAMLNSDPGARYLGEFAIGANYGIQKFTKSILYDEKLGGTIHMALGAGYPETGSTNQSAIHWDMICDMRTDSEILVDGELFYKNGQFQI